MAIKVSTKFRNELKKNVNVPVTILEVWQEFGRIKVAEATGGTTDSVQAAAYHNGFIYYATMDSPAKIYKVNEDTLAIEDTLTLDGGENIIEHAMEVDATNDDLYVATATFPSILVKIDLGAFTRTGAITFPAGENRSRVILIDEANELAYVAGLTHVVKVNLNTFLRVGSVAAASPSTSFKGGAIDLTNNIAYFGDTSSPGHVQKFDLDTFTKDDSLTLDTGENLTTGLAIDEASQKLWVGGTDDSTVNGFVARIDLGTFTKDTAVTIDASAITASSLSAGSVNSTELYYDAATDFLYGVSNMVFWQIRNSDFTIMALIPVPEQEITDGLNNPWWVSFTADPTNNVVYGGSRVGDATVPFFAKFQTSKLLHKWGTSKG